MSEVAGSSAPSAEDVRAEVTEWLAANWDDQLPLLDWRERLVASGWGCPSWPTEWYGRGLPPSMDRVVEGAFAEAGAVGVASGVSMYLVAPTLLEWADDDQRRRFLRPILTGEHKWCQLFSEPGAGSDLAGLQTRAILDGEQWVVNGQKVWNSGAHKAQYGILMARSDVDASKHAGISYFLIPMQQDGIEVRPLRQMNRHASFNEVFLTDALVPAENLLAGPGDGWRVALTTLAHERSAVATRRPRYAPDGGPTVQQAKAESDEYFSTYKWYPQRAGRANLVIPEAQRTGQVNDPLIRQRIAAVQTITSTSSWTTQRARDARRAGLPPGPEGSVAKLNLSVGARLCHGAHTAIAGAHGMLTGPDTAAGGMVAEVLVSTPAQSIAGGTDEIQRNILGERVLGLAKEPDPNG